MLDHILIFLGLLGISSGDNPPTPDVPPADNGQLDDDDDDDDDGVDDTHVIESCVKLSKTYCK